MSGNSISQGVAYRDQLVKGTPTNDNALAGDFGEIIEATVATPGATLSSTAVSNVTSVKLTGGDWDVDGVVDFALAATTAFTVLQAGVSDQTGVMLAQTGDTTVAGVTVDTDPFVQVVTASSEPNAGAGTIYAMRVPTTRVKVAQMPVGNTVTIWLVAQATFATAACTAFGSLRARRVR